MGITGITGLRFYIMWLSVLVYTLRCAVLKLKRVGEVYHFVLFTKAFHLRRLFIIFWEVVKMDSDSSIPHIILLTYWCLMHSIIWQTFLPLGGTIYGILLDQYSKTPFELG